MPPASRGGAQGVWASCGPLHTQTGSYSLLEVSAREQMQQDATVPPADYWAKQNFKAWAARSPQAQKAIHRLMHDDQGAWQDPADQELGLESPSAAARRHHQRNRVATAPRSSLASAPPGSLYSSQQVYVIRDPTKPPGWTSPHIRTAPPPSAPAGGTPTPPCLTSSASMLHDSSLARARSPPGTARGSGSMRRSQANAAAPATARPGTQGGPAPPPPLSPRGGGAQLLLPRSPPHSAPCSPRPGTSHHTEGKLAVVVDEAAKDAERHIQVARKLQQGRMLHTAPTQTGTVAHRRREQQLLRASTTAPASGRPLTPTTIADWDLLLEPNRAKMMKRLDAVTTLLRVPTPPGAARPPPQPGGQPYVPAASFATHPVTGEALALWPPSSDAHDDYRLLIDFDADVLPSVDAILQQLPPMPTSAGSSSVTAVAQATEPQLAPSASLGRRGSRQLSGGGPLSRSASAKAGGVSRQGSRGAAPQRAGSAVARAAEQEAAAAPRAAWEEAEAADDGQAAPLRSVPSRSQRQGSVGRHAAAAEQQHHSGGDAGDARALPLGGAGGGSLKQRQSAAAAAHALPGRPSSRLSMRDDDRPGSAGSSSSAASGGSSVEDAAAVPDQDSRHHAGKGAGHGPHAPHHQHQHAAGEVQVEASFVGILHQQMAAQGGGEDEAGDLDEEMRAHPSAFATMQQHHHHSHHAGDAAGLHPEASFQVDPAPHGAAGGHVTAHHSVSAGAADGEAAAEQHLRRVGSAGAPLGARSPSGARSSVHSAGSTGGGGGALEAVGEDAALVVEDTSPGPQELELDPLMQHSSRPGTAASDRPASSRLRSASSGSRRLNSGGAGGGGGSRSRPGSSSLGRRAAWPPIPLDESHIPVEAEEEHGEPATAAAEGGAAAEQQQAHGVAPPEEEDVSFDERPSPQNPVQTAGIGYTVVRSVTAPLRTREEVEEERRLEELQGLQDTLGSQAARQAARDASRAAKALSKMAGEAAQAIGGVSSGSVAVATPGVSMVRTVHARRTSLPSSTPPPAAPSPAAAPAARAPKVPRASHDAKPSPKLVATSQPQDYRHKQGVTEIGTVHMQDIWA